MVIFSVNYPFAECKYKFFPGFVEAALMPYVESGQLAGAISVLYNDGVEEVACVGYSDLAAGRKITMDDVFMQCSQTKGFCGVTMAKLVEEGKVSLDDPVSKYLPEFRDLWVLEGESDSLRTLRRARNMLTIRMVALRVLWVRSPWRGPGGTLG